MPRAKSPPLDPRVRALLSPTGKLTTTAAGIPYDQPAAARVDAASATWDRASTTAPFREVPLAGLRALQRTLGPESVTHFLRHPDAPADTAVMVLRFDGRDYVTNGHHRVAAAKLRGDRTIRARYLDVDARAASRGPRAFARGDLRAMARERVAAERARDAAGINGAEELHERVRHHHDLVRALDRAQRAEYDQHYREARSMRSNPTTPDEAAVIRAHIREGERDGKRADPHATVAEFFGDRARMLAMSRAAAVTRVARQLEHNADLDEFAAGMRERGYRITRGNARHALRAWAGAYARFAVANAVNNPAPRRNPTPKPRAPTRYTLTMQPNDRHPYRIPVRLAVEWNDGGRWRKAPGSAAKLHYNATTGAVNGLDATPHAAMGARDRAALRTLARRAFRELYPRGIPRAR